MLDRVAWWLVLIGALNWLLVGLFNWDLVQILFGNYELLARAVYVIIGLGGAYLLPQAFGVQMIPKRK